MKIYEFQAKDLLKNQGVAVPEGLLYSGDLSSLGYWDKYVLKAQVYAGGRGKAGGVKIVRGRKEVSGVIFSMLGSRLITPQTDKNGVVVEKVLIEEFLSVKKEFYVAMTMDRSRGLPVLMASTSGGMEIEEVAKKSGSAILTETINSPADIYGYKLRRLCTKLGLEKHLNTFRLIVELFFKYDATLIEINPMVLTVDGRLIAGDAKMIFDDSALPRHKELLKLRDPRGEDEREFVASESGISYVSLDGTVGCIVNGAGLAMATMDIIKHHGESPANFLDVGGGAAKEKVKLAFRILLSNEDVRVILINIFGGIMRCDILADAIVEVVAEDKISLPIVIRMKGTNDDQGRKILNGSGIQFAIADSMDEAAEKCAEIVRSLGSAKLKQQGSI